MNTDTMELVRILVRRDKIPQAEAEDRVQEFEREARSMLGAALESGEEGGFEWGMDTLEVISDLAMDHLGLEPDHVEYLIHELC